MDNTIFILLGVLAVSIGLPFAVRWAREKYGVSEQDLKTASDILNISIMILEELDFEKSDDVVGFATVVRISIEFASEFEGEDDKEEMKLIAYDHAITQLENLKVEATDRRKQIIKMMIDTTLKFYV
jgi:hypothetical protein